MAGISEGNLQGVKFDSADSGGLKLGLSCDKVEELTGVQPVIR